MSCRLQLCTKGRLSREESCPKRLIRTANERRWYLEENLLRSFLPLSDAFIGSIVQGAVVIHPYRWLRCNPRGEENLMTILPLRKSGIWWIPSIIPRFEVGQQTPAVGHVHDYQRIEKVVVGSSGCGGGSPPNGRSVPLASTFLWRYGSTHAYRGPIRTCLFNFIPQGKDAPVPTEKDGWPPVWGPQASRSGKFRDPAGNKGSEQRQHI